MIDVPLLVLEGLSVSFRTRHGPVAAVTDVTLGIAPGEALGLVGESGSGKSTVGLAALGYVAPGGRIVAGRVRFSGRDLAEMTSAEIERLRGGGVALVPQEPGSALNPSLVIGRQLTEVPAVHRGATADQARNEAVTALADVGLPDPARILVAYPHQLSGGQQQRVVIAMALLARPKLLVLDEPTTALDATVEAGIVRLIRALRDRRGMALLYISHNLGLVREIADRVAVMEAGRVVETADVEAIFRRPQHPYTRRLIDILAVPPGARDCSPLSERPELLQITDLHKHYPVDTSALLMRSRRDTIRANDGINLDLRRAETVAIVGESGSGKTTLAKIVVGLEAATAGRVRFAGEDVAQVPVEQRRREQRRAVQMVFQNPDATLNPSHTVGAQVARAVRKLGGRSDAPSIAARVGELFDRLRLGRDLAERRPHQLSGGQKQRIGIARALAGAPELIVADEPVSALDVTIRAAILGILRDVQDRDGTALLLITHDVLSVRALADRIVVMYLGRIVEQGTADQVFAPPYHPYTEALLAAVPVADPALRKRTVILEGAIPSALHIPPGCRFHTRCPRKLGAICETVPPPERIAAPGHVIACHIPVEDLARVPPVFERVEDQGPALSAPGRCA